MVLRFILLQELFELKRLNYFVNRINWNLEEATIEMLLALIWIYNKTDSILSCFYYFIVVLTIF